MSDIAASTPPVSMPASRNVDSEVIAVQTLRSELEMVDGALESLDRKAALIPAVLGTVAGLFIAPNQKFTTVQQGLLLIAVLIGVASVVVALRVLRAQHFNIGPKAATVAGSTHLSPADFNHAVAGSLAMAVAQLSEMTELKARGVNRAMALAAATILFLALARLVGG